MVEQQAQKPVNNKLSKLTKIVILICLILFALICIALLTIFVINKNSKNNNLATQTTNSNINLPEASNTQALEQPNAGRTSGESLLSEVEKAKKDADALVVVINATPQPKTDAESTELSKKYLQLGKLYFTAMLYQDAFNSLSKVTRAESKDIAEANYYMAKCAAISGNKKLAIQFYDQAIKALEQSGGQVVTENGPQNIDNTDLIEKYKAEKALL
jgi:tetratricopeptide (TPR) repeat protein